MRKMELNIQLFASGTILFPASGALQGKIEWSSTPNNSLNLSSVNTAIYARRTSGYTTGRTWNGNVNVNGNNNIFNQIYTGVSTKIETDWVLIAAFANNIQHDIDGKKLITISGSVTGPSGTSLSGVTSSGSDDCELDIIPRKANIKGYWVTAYDESNIILEWENPAAGSVTKLELGMFLKSDDTEVVPYIELSKNASGEYIFALTEAQRDIIRNSVPNDKETTIYYSLKTTIGTDVYYDTEECTIMIINAKPVFTNFDYNDTDANTLEITGDSKKLIKGYSNVKITVSTANKAVAQKGSTMETYSFENAGMTTPTPKAYSGTAAVEETLNYIQDDDLIVRATDSRGFSTAVTKKVPTFINYFLPIITSQSAIRTDNVETETTLNIDGYYCDWEGLLLSNSVQYAEYRYREKGGSWSGYMGIDLDVNADGYYSYSGILYGDLGIDGFTATKSFEIEITIVDILDYTVSSKLITLNSAQPLFWKFKNSVKSLLGIGKKPDTSMPHGSIDVAGDLKVRGNISSDGNISGIISGDTVPIGAGMWYPSNTIPDNWLLCNGQAVSRTTYSDLFSVLGTSHGSGDGSTTFNLPNIKGRTIVGRDSADTDFDTIGETRGEKTHTLTALEIPKHTHPIGTKAMWGSPTTSNTWDYLSRSPNNGNYEDKEDAPYGVKKQTTGDGAHNNLQPSIVENYIIKAKQSTGVVATVVDGFNSTSAINAGSAKNDKDLKDNYTQQNVTTGGSGVKCGYQIDGKDVYRKRINFGALPNATTKSVQHGLTNFKIVGFNAYATRDSDNTTINIPYYNTVYSIEFTIYNTTISIAATNDRSQFNAVVDIYYISNS